ncbi:MAG: MarR family transcriptional regulator [Candidatus Undinarchaeales archaeon]|jgi:uncharacterized membrane protein|nr:MarR family transcriptional regulator [Candidatus Undinarchaeales archaeon]
MDIGRLLFRIGIILLIVSAINIVLIKNFTDMVQESRKEACALACAAGSCPDDMVDGVNMAETPLTPIGISRRILSCSDQDHDLGTPIETYVSIITACISALVGIMMIEISRRLSSEGVDVAKKMEHILDTLEGEEREVYRLVTEADGSIMQSDIVNNTSLTKVKVTRLLDKLEGKGLVERRRRGMGNLVVLKH